MKLAAALPIARTLGRELVITVLLLLGVSLVVFGILYLAPGDPFSALLEGQMPDARAIAGLREAMGVPDTWYGQYWAWASNLLTGNFGTSVRTGQSVGQELQRVGINTLILTLGSMLVTLLIAVPIALSAAARGRGSLSAPLTLAAYVVSALPVFWFGYIVIYIFIHYFNIFPLAFGGTSDDGKLWIYYLLPILVLGVGNGTLSEVIRFLREEIGRVLAEDYIRTARAKGARVWRHAFKEGFLIPITEIVASKIPFILGGAVIVEQVFNWPGMGRLAWQAAQDRDFPVIMGIAIVAAAFVRLGTLLQRVVVTAVNPRAAQE